MEIAELGEETFRRTRLSQSELDEEARAFALILIERWILDPSNVLLLRVALDLWPSRQLLEEVLKLFEPYLVGNIRAVTSRQVAYYCLAEKFRAGSDATGFILDPDGHPAFVTLDVFKALFL